MSFLTQWDMALNCNNAGSLPKDGVKAGGNPVQQQRKIGDCMLALNYSAQFVSRIEDNLCDICSVALEVVSFVLFLNMCGNCFFGIFFFLERMKERRPITSKMLIRRVKHIHSTKLLTFIYLESKHRVL